MTLIHWISRQHQNGSLTGHTQVKPQTNIDQATDNCFKVDYGLPLRGKLWPTTVAVGEPDKIKTLEVRQSSFFFLLRACGWSLLTHHWLHHLFQITKWQADWSRRWWEKTKKPPQQQQQQSKSKKVIWQWLPNFKMTFLAVCKSLPPGHDRSKVPSHTSWKGLGM